MKLKAEKTITRDFELTDDEIATLKKAQRIVDDISEKMKRINDDQEFEVYLKEKVTSEETTTYDLDLVYETIEHLLNSELDIDEY